MSQRQTFGVSEAGHGNDDCMASRAGVGAVAGRARRYEGMERQRRVGKREMAGSGVFASWKAKRSKAEEDAAFVRRCGAMQCSACDAAQAEEFASGQGSVA